MPQKGKTSRPAHEIAQAMARYEAGESVEVLAKYYKISKPGFYLWLKKHKQAKLAAAMKANMTRVTVEKSDKQSLLTEVVHLRAEVVKLRNKLFEALLKIGDL